MSCLSIALTWEHRKKHDMNANNRTYTAWRFPMILGIASITSVIHAKDTDQSPLLTLDTYRVVSTGTRTERLQQDVPVKTEVLGADLLFTFNAGDVASALEYLPGARVEANCQNCGTSEVKLLGLGAGYNRLLFDGQPLFSGLAAVYGLEHISTSFIERIEVVKGGASSLYGAGAVAGVINIIPHEPLQNEIDFRFTLESMDGKPSLAAALKKDWYGGYRQHAGTVYGDYRRSDAVDLNGDGFSDITEKEFSSVGTHFWVYPTKTGRIRANYGYTWEERRGGDRLDLAPHETQITEMLKHRWQRGGLFWDQDLGPSFSYKIGASLSTVERDSYYGGIGAVAMPGEAIYDEAAYLDAVEGAKLLYGFTTSERLYLDSLATWKRDSHTISIGAQYQRDDVFDEKRNDLGQPLRSDGSVANASGEDPIADGRFENVGVFVQDEWDPDANWTLVLGLRTDKHSELTDWIFSPRGAIRYTATEDLILRASVSTGFRAPEIFDEDFHIEILDDPTRVRNSPQLKEEKSISYAAGLLWSPAIAQRRFQLDFDLYHTRISDSFHVPDLVLLDMEGIAYKERINAGASTIEGFELNGRFRFSNHLSVEGGVAYNRAQFDESQEIFPDFFERRFVETPAWTGKMQLAYTNEALVDVFLGVNYTGSMIAVNQMEGWVNEKTDRFWVVDLSFTKHLPLGGSEAPPHIDVSIGVRNLLDQRQKDLTSGPERDAGYFYGPRFPRSFFLSVRTHF
jgi:outer membrane receptor for ferrienterochelin and colicins